jgi:hypothetical protein
MLNSFFPPLHSDEVSTVFDNKMGKKWTVSETFQFQTVDEKQWVFVFGSHFFLGSEQWTVNRKKKKKKWTVDIDTKGLTSSGLATELKNKMLEEIGGIMRRWPEITCIETTLSLSHCQKSQQTTVNLHENHPCSINFRPNLVIIIQMCSHLMSNHWVGVKSDWIQVVSIEKSCGLFLNNVFSQESAQHDEEVVSVRYFCMRVIAYA